jgi:predicted transcriptional regulator
MGRFRGKGNNSPSNLWCLASSLLAICEGKLLQKPWKAEHLMLLENHGGSMNASLERPASPEGNRTYTYSELRDVLGFSDGQIHDNYSKENDTAFYRQQANHSSLMSVSETELNLANQNQALVGKSLNTKAFPPDARAYTLEDLKDKFGFSDEDVRKYFSKVEQAPVANSAGGGSVGLQATPASATTVRRYTYSELRNEFGFSDNQIRDYFSKAAAAGNTAQESFNSAGGLGDPSTEFALSSITAAAPSGSMPPSVSSFPDVGKTYTYTELRDHFGLSDKNILDYYSKQNPATRFSQQDVSSTVMVAPPVDRTYTYSELRKELGFSDEQILDYYMKHDPTTQMQQNSGSSSSAGNFSVMPAPMQPSRTYTYSEMHDELGLSDDQILSYYSSLDVAKREDLEGMRSASGSVPASVPSLPQSMARTYTYGELRNDLGFSDEQILDYYLKHDPSSVENGRVRGMSAPAVENRVYTYSELRDELGFNDAQILDYYRRQDPVAKDSVSSLTASANASADGAANSSALTYSQLRNEFGLNDDQIIEYYSELEHSKHSPLLNASVQSATAKSVTSHTRVGKTYTYSELRDVLGYSDAQIAEYYSNTEEGKQVSQDIESSGSSPAGAVNRSYTYAELRDDLGFTDEQILEYYMELDPAAGSAAASVRPSINRAYTYSELRDELGLSDMQILDYYSRTEAKFSAAANVSSPDVTANSSASTLEGRAYTYSELRDEFRLSDDQIIDYYKQVEANHNGTESELLSGRKNDHDYDSIRGQRRAGKSYTYSELRDVLGWSDEQIMSYYASHDESPAVNTAAPLEKNWSSRPPSGRLYTYSELRDVLGFNDQQILEYFAQWDRQTQLTPPSSGFPDGSSASSSVPGDAEMQPASTSSDRTYTYAELRDVLGMSNDQILTYYAKRESAQRTPPLSLLEISKSTVRSANIGSSSLNNSVASESVQATGVNSSSPILGRMYTYSELRHGLGFSDQQILDYYSSAAPSRPALSASPEAQKTYTYTELRDDIGLTDEQILDYYRTRHQRAVSSSGFGNSSVMSAPPVVGETYTYTELRDQFGLTDQQILDYYTKHDAADRFPQSVGSTNSITSSVMSAPSLVDGTYTYSELRGLGLSDDQILEHYSDMARAKQSALSSTATADATANSSALSTFGRVPPIAGRIYTHSELQDEFGLTDAQIIDYYSRARGTVGTVSDISGDPSAVENFDSHGTMIGALRSPASREYTYSEMRDVLGYTEAQILDNYSQKDAEMARPRVSSPTAVAISSPLPTLDTKAYTYSDLRNKLGFSDEQILNYYANVKTESTGMSGTSVESSAITNSNYGTGIAQSMGNLNGDEETQQPLGVRSYTYSEMRDVLRMSDAQILDYYKEQDARRMQLPVGGVPSEVVNSSNVYDLDSTSTVMGPAVDIETDMDTSLASPLAGKTYTYSELRDKLGFNDAQIQDYYSRALAKHTAGASIRHPRETIYPSTSEGFNDNPRSVQQLSNRTYTYSELHDVLGLSNEQILDYYSKIDQSKSLSLPNIGSGFGSIDPVP